MRAHSSLPKLVVAAGATGLAPAVRHRTAWRDGDRGGQAVDPEVGTLSREEVVRSERRAWAGADHDDGRVYLYDGINFWCRRGRSDPQPAAPWRTPQSGWRHREDCHCERCAS
jgi:hypothetical protein